MFALAIGILFNKGEFANLFKSKSNPFIMEPELRPWWVNQQK